MLSKGKLRLICVVALSVLVLMGVTYIPLMAQGTTGTILGTVTDSSGGVVPDAMVQVTNAGTGANQTVTSDAQGRYRAQDLQVGDYRVSTQKAGFESVVHTGITLNAGANVVVDFALPVGQVTQAVTVEGNVTQVETTSAAISTVVEPTQMRDLPLNGRNFEELILLEPGVVNNNSPNINKSGVSSLIGTSNFWSVSGSRQNGQGELLDGTNIQNYQDRGTGSGILGTSLGIDSIAEFQVLTNTYGAQYGGNGSVVNAVTRSGTNNIHGSAYEFLRNSALDARNFTDTARQPYKRNQFGGTFGGPIKKDKMFIFVNYEGLRENLGQSVIETVPDSFTLQGLLPSSVTGGVPGTCANAGAINPAYPTTLYSNCGAGSLNAAKFAIMQPYLNLYNPVVAGFTMSEVTSNGLPTGTAQIHDSAPQPGTEDYVVSRYDWTISNNDSIFSRYLIDTGHLTEPFATIPQYSQLDRTRNQFFTIGEKHIFSTNVINALNLAYSRTYLDLHTPGQAGNILNWSGDMWSSIYGSAAPTEGTLSPGAGIVSVGPSGNAPDQYIQNKFGVADDVFWTKGAHSFRIGGSAYRMQFQGLHPLPGIGGWSFNNLPQFFTDVPLSFNGPCNYANGEPGCVSAAGTPLPLASPRHDARDTDFSIYVQDDWKASSTLTVNLGLRYSPTSNAWDALHQIYLLVPPPFGVSGNLPSPTANGTPVPSTYTPENNFMLQNPSFHNIDPRVGVAWDPFKDHKTSVRAGFGTYHTVLQVRDYSYASFYSFPWVSATQLSPTPLTFPTPFQAAVAVTPQNSYGFSIFPTTPYLEQWNLSLQREVMKNTVLTISYVGSQGVHLESQRDSNPPALTGQFIAPGTGANCGLPSGSACGAVSLAAGQTLWPSFPNQLQTLKSVSGSAAVYNPANGTVSCAAACTLAAPGGQAIVDPATGQPAFSHIIQTAATTYTIASNNRLNPYFGFMNTGGTDTNSHYNALQASLIRRMTNNFSLQISYTYSDCVDISSGSWGGEGGTNNINPYILSSDRGRCNFMIRHNVTTNGLYQLPFKRNQLVAGWQVGGVMYFSTGAPFSVETFSQGNTDIGGNANRPNYVPNAANCNSQPTNYQVTGTGVFFVNGACFAEAPVGEMGNLGRNAFIQPDVATFNANLQKNTRINERFNLQFRVEAFNLFNRKNFTYSGQTAVALTEQGTTSATAVATGITTSTFGQFTNVIGYPLNGSARQLQFGLKLIF